MLRQAQNIPLMFFPLGVVEHFKSRGASLAALLQRTNISGDQLESSHTYISYPELSVVMHNAATIFGVGSGVGVGLKMPWCFYGQLSEIIECSHSLAAAGLAFRRYIALTQPYYHYYYRTPDYYLTRDDEIVCPIPTLELGHYSEKARQFEFELRLATTLHLFADCGDPAMGRKSIEIALNRSHAECYGALDKHGFRVNVHNGPSCIRAPHALFISEWRSFRKPLFESTLARLEAQHYALNIDRTMSGAVRWHISRSFIRQVSQDQIAEKLGISSRTLTRKLAKEGVSFREILQEVKMEIACRHICYSELSLETIAEMMGFSCGASLRRAIKNWTGHSPAHMKKVQLSGTTLESA